VNDHRIWIAQVLCPSRHAIVAVAFDVAEYSPDDAVARLQSSVSSTVAAGGLNPWCGLCGSRVWTVEAGPTPWTTMDEAAPHIKAIEQANLQSRSILTQRGDRQ
jgi:hypothetical protein